MDKKITTVTADVLCQLFNLKKSKIYELSINGIVSRSTEKARFNLVASVSGYVKDLQDKCNLKANAGAGNDELIKKKIEQLEIANESARLKLQVEKSGLLTAEEFHDGLMSQARILTEGLSGFVDLAEQNGVTDPDVLAVLDKTVAGICYAIHEAARMAVGNLEIDVVQGE